MPPIPFDDTPPPPERPLLRQPVGFAWSGSKSGAAVEPPALNTYQATLPSTNASTGTFFLPGQAVPPAPSKKKTSTSRTKKSDGHPKKRRPASYAQQTSRFRLQAYDPSLSEKPPIQQGEGAYSSMFRGTPADAFNAAASPASTLTSSYGGDGSPPAMQSPTPESLTAQSRQTQFSVKKIKQTRGSQKTRSDSARSHATHGSSISTNRATSVYYRRNYDTYTTPQVPRHPVDRNPDNQGAYSPDALSNVAQSTFSHDKSPKEAGKKLSTTG